VIFASKTPRDLNHDPKPYVDYQGQRHTEEEAMGDLDHAPRPEYDHAQHNEPNTLLVTFRTIWKGHPGTIQGYLAGITGAVTEDDEPQLIARVEHARCVLTRLATLTEGGA
jgi:hypothetical protein